jgi:hypothetical protein
VLRSSISPGSTSPHRRLARRRDERLQAELGLFCKKSVLETG